MRAPLFIPIILMAAALAGCAQNGADDDAQGPTTTTPATTPDATPDPTPITDEPAARAPGEYEQMGFDGTTWPRLDGVTLTILDHGAFGAFDDASAAFTALTGAKVEHIEADDSGSALYLAVQQRGNPTFDVLYGVDNILYQRAVEQDVFEPYKPLLADRIAPEYVFFDANGTWHATPVDHGYVAVNYDPRAVQVESLRDLVTHADQFVTMDPRTSTPGQGFLLATIAAFPEDSDYSWKQYWNDLFAGGVLVTSGWTEAYEQHFTAGYGADFGGAADRAIVTSYTTSPAYEHHFGRAEENLARVLTTPNSTFHQVETMGIAKGTQNRAAAEAWIEFTLTEAFQNLTAPAMAVYPVVANVSADETFGDVDPAPGSFEPAPIRYQDIGANLEGWIREWVDLCEAVDCA